MDNTNFNPEASTEQNELSYIKHQIYGDLPSVTMKDSRTIDAFNNRSPWAFSRYDSPFTFEEAEDDSENDNIESVQKEQVPLGMFTLQSRAG